MLTPRLADFSSGSGNGDPFSDSALADAELDCAPASASAPAAAMVEFEKVSVAMMIIDVAAKGTLVGLRRRVRLSLESCISMCHSEKNPNRIQWWEDERIGRNAPFPILN